MNTSVRRNSGSSRTLMLCLVAAVVGGAACLLLLYCPNKNEIALRTAVEGLRRKVQDLEAKAADPKEVERLRAQAREAVELKKEAEEVHRLRGEVTLLRKDKTQFDRAKTENAQLRVAAQQAQRLQAEMNAARGQSQVQPQPQAAGTVTAVMDTGQARDYCNWNMKLIDGATQQWALENRKSAKDTVEVNAIKEFLRGSVMHPCPSGGIYRFSTRVAGPICSVHGGPRE